MVSRSSQFIKNIQIMDNKQQTPDTKSNPSPTDNRGQNSSHRREVYRSWQHQGEPDGPDNEEIVRNRRQQCAS